MNNAIIARIDDMIVLALSVDIFDRDKNCPIISSSRSSFVPGLVMLVTINVVTAAGKKKPIMKKKKTNKIECILGNSHEFRNHCVCVGGR